MVPLLPMRVARALFALRLLVLLPGPWAEAAASPPAADTSVHAEDHHLTHRLLTDIEKAVAGVELWLQRYGYGAVFVVVGVEGFGMPAPGQTILEAGAAASAARGSRLRIHWVVLAAFLAASLGAALGYLFGRTGGRRLLKRLRIPERHLEPAAPEDLSRTRG